MKTLGWLIALLICVGVAGGIGFVIGRHHSPDTSAKDNADESASSSDDEPKPVVQVTVEPAKIGTLSHTITAYGTVIAQPAQVQIISAPFECRVVKTLVSPGEQVAAGAETIQIEASPDTLVALQEAKNAVTNAENDLAQVQERFKQHLATNTELGQSEQTAQAAKLKLDSLVQRGAGASQTYKARAAGIVSKVDVQDGQIAPAGAPLVELAPTTQIEVQLNVEPADAPALKPGIKVEIQPVSSATTQPTISGTIRLIGQRVDSSTRMVDVRVSIPPDTHLMLDNFVVGHMTVATAEGFIIPRDAALPNEDGTFSLFTVKDNHAVLHSVRVGVQQDQSVEVIAPDVRTGDPVVVSGNYLLKDGMEVAITAPASQPSSQSAQESNDANTEAAP